MHGKLLKELERALKEMIRESKDNTTHRLVASSKTILLNKHTPDQFFIEMNKISRKSK